MNNSIECNIPEHHVIEARNGELNSNGEAERVAQIIFSSWITQPEINVVWAVERPQDLNIQQQWVHAYWCDWLTFSSNECMRVDVTEYVKANTADNNQINLYAMTK